MEINPEFWAALDQLVAQSKLCIDRPKGTAHPRYPAFIYPLDYGYLDETASMDQQGIDCWVGTEKERRADAIVCVLDLVKRDSEIKILLGCTEEEKALVYETCNGTDKMKGILVRRVDERA